MLQFGRPQCVLDGVVPKDAVAAYHSHKRVHQRVRHRLRVDATALVVQVHVLHACIVAAKWLRASP